MDDLKGADRLDDPDVEEVLDLNDIAAIPRATKKTMLVPYRSHRRMVEGLNAADDLARVAAKVHKLYHSGKYDLDQMSNLMEALIHHANRYYKVWED